MVNLARKIARDAGWRSERPQPTIYDNEGGYMTLQPTKGWKRVSAGRIRAQRTMMEKFGFIR